MALIFSCVSISADNQTESLLVGGIPQDYYDLKGWTAFDRLLEEMEKSEVSVHVETYLYGDGESVSATPAEVAYLMNRIEIRPDFLSARCEKIKDSDFSFEWSPDRLLQYPFLEY